MPTILIVDDEKDFCNSLSDLLQSEGYETISAFGGREAIFILENKSIDLVFLDINLPGMKGIEVLEKIKNIEESLPVIMLTGYGEIKSAVDSMKKGAFNYLTKPFNNDELLIVIKKAIEIKKLGREVYLLKERLQKHEEKTKIICKSEKMERMLDEVKRVAPTDMTVIIQGASGTGKELIARFIHELSKRKTGPFIAIDCGALPENLVESELFGYEKGAFTGADKVKPGHFELADGGTLFLDEISNLSQTVQMKLLRVLQEKKVQHLGDKKEIGVDIRIVVASNINLDELMPKGLFREDLYHRLNEFTINLPSLKERKEDILILVEHFLKQANCELSKKIKGVAHNAMEILSEYSWPGNVRELKNTIKRAVLLTEGDIILPEHIKLTDNALSHKISLNPPLLKGEISLKQMLNAIERELLIKALMQTNYHKSKASKLLGIDRSVLSDKIKKYKVSSSSFLKNFRYTNNLKIGSKHSLKKIIDDIEKQKITDVLKEVNYKIAQASKILKITRTDIYYKIKKHNITLPIANKSVVRHPA